MARAKEVADTYRNKVRAGKCFRATYLNAALATTASDGIAGLANVLEPRT
jgi:hypothetical protein